MKKAFCLWFTGLPSSGKTTLAKAIQVELANHDIKTIHLDGDVLREGLNSDLGFSKEDREENNRRVIYLAKLLVENNIPTIVSFISPYKSIRDKAKSLIPNTIQVYVKCPIEECEKRDVKGLYAKARVGEIKGMTGVDDPYEEPKNPDIIIKTYEENVRESVEKLIKYLEQGKYLNKEYE